MAYCTYGDDSDVYVWTSGKNLICDDCTLAGADGGPGYRLRRNEFAVMANHLRYHISTGDLVPPSAILRLDLQAAGKPAPSQVEKALRRWGFVSGR